MRLSLLRFGYIPPDLRKKLLFGLLTLLLIGATIPVGLYLVSKPQDPRSRASEELVTVGQTGFFLETKKTEWNGLEEIPVTIIAKSDTVEANLFVTKLAFDPSRLEVIKVASVSGTPNSIEGDYFIKKWVEASFDNTSGTISVIGGVPITGLKTTSEKKYVVATVIFKAKKIGDAQINFMEQSAIYKNTDNLDISILKQPISFSITGQIEASELTKKASPKPQIASSLTIISPSGGESYPYLGVIPVRWTAKDIEQISLSLYKDGAFFGRVFDFIPNPNQYDWEPKKSLSLPFINDGSSFQVELKGRAKSGEILNTLSGPFIINLSARIASPSARIIPIPVDLRNLSVLFSAYGQSNSTSDFNSDGLVNDLDLWILKNALLAQKIIN